MRASSLWIALGVAADSLAGWLPAATQLETINGM